MNVWLVRLASFFASINVFKLRQIARNKPFLLCSICLVIFLVVVAALSALLPWNRSSALVSFFKLHENTFPLIPTRND